MVIFLIILASIVSTVLGGLFALRFKDKLHLILGFSAGAVLGVALFDLLPESIELTSSVYDLRTLMLLVAIGFSIYMLIDMAFSIHKHSDSECHNLSHRGKISAAAFVIHSMLDGFSIGLAFKVSPAVGWLITTAVLIHKFSDGLNTVGVIINSNGRQKEALRWLAANSIAPAVGVGISSLLVISESTLGLILAVFVGLFLYISTSELIPESHHSHPTIWTGLSIVIGLSVIFIAAQLTL